MSTQYNVTVNLIGGGSLDIGMLEEGGLDTMYGNLGTGRGRMRFRIGDEVHLIPLPSVHSIRAVKVPEGEQA